jgi:enamine deaminase RidA (YjgF/YER057c/UK114 family)
MPKRQVFHIPGLDHGTNPIPFAVRIDNVLYTGSIDGRVPGTGQASSDPNEQIVQAFRNVRQLMEIVGGSVGDIGKVAVRLSDLALRSKLNDEWAAMFPDEHDRPVRHTSRADIAGGHVIQIEITAHLGD